MIGARHGMRAGPSVGEDTRAVRSSARRSMIYIALALLLAAASPLLAMLDWSTGPALHTNLEVIATVLALINGGLALARFYSHKSATYLFIGTGFLGTALFDGYHAVVTTTAVAPALPSALDSLIPWSWMASRLFLSVLLLLSCVLWRQTYRRGGASGSIHERSTYLLVTLLVIATFLLFLLIPMPQGYYPALFLKRPEELVPGTLFAMAVLFYLRKGAWRYDPFEHWLIVCLILNLHSQILYMPFSSALFDAHFDMAHLLKNAGYGCAFIGLLTSVHASFRQADIAGELQQRVAQRTAELEAANKELESFSYSVSHDLRQPLRSMDGFSKILRDRYRDQLDERGKNYLDRIRAGAQRMGQLIDGLLELSQVKQAKLQREEVDLAGLARDIGQDLQATDTARRVQLVIGEHLLASADRRMMINLLQNLISNAWKFTSREPRARITIDKLQRDAGEIFFVRDNGAGFDEQHAEKLFHVFQRLHGQHEFPGLGIGLATAQRIIQYHGGRIWAESKPGEGATFYFTLPR